MSHGRVYSLKPLFQRLNRTYFEGGLKCALSWGRVRGIRVRRVRQLGRYEPQKNRIVLNPVLDQPQVPLHVVTAILHHEMCHAAVPSKRERGRNRCHTPEFHKRERTYDRFHEAKNWIRENRRFLFQPPKNHLVPPQTTAKERQLTLFGE